MALWGEHHPTAVKRLLYDERNLLVPPIIARHKDYLFQKRLAVRIPIDSFRFDFR